MKLVKGYSVDLLKRMSKRYLERNRVQHEPPVQEYLNALNLHEGDERHCALEAHAVDLHTIERDKRSKHKSSFNFHLMRLAKKVGNG